MVERLVNISNYGLTYGEYIYKEKLLPIER
jgi:hypothetical protein